MKIKLFSLMFLFTIVGALFTGCSSDNESNNDDSSSSESLVGYWIRYEDNGQYLEELGLFADGTCNYTEVVEPNDDSNEDSSYDFGEGTYVVKGNKLIMTLTFGDETEVWTYIIKSSKAKKTLVLTDEEGSTYTFNYTQSQPNKPSVDDMKYKIVGTWKASYYWKYSGITETIVMEVNKNGKLAYTDHNSKTNETEVGEGSWKYNSSTGKWNLQTQTSLLSGDYSLIGNELVCKTTFEDGSSRTVTFKK